MKKKLHFFSASTLNRIHAVTSLRYFGGQEAITVVLIAAFTGQQ